MRRIISDKPGRVQAFHDTDGDFILLDWTSFSIKLADIEAMHKTVLETAMREHCFHFLAETSKVRDVFPQNVIQWWGETWVPRLEQAGIRAIVTVVPSSALASLSTRSWQAEVVRGISMVNVKSLTEGVATVKDLQARAR